MTSRSSRKTPKQERSKDTVLAIVEAGAQLLVEVGYHKASTNRIAKRAGVSIGSLYQYFSDKDAVVSAVVNQFADRQMLILGEGVLSAQDLPLKDAVDRIIDTILHAKRVEPELNRVLFNELPPLGQVDIYHQWSQSACALIGLALEARADEITPQNLSLASFILVHACHGILTGTVTERPDLLDDGELKSETVRLIMQFLAPDQLVKLSVP